MRTVILTAALALAPAVAHGQQAVERTDVRWEALTGCWRPVEGLEGATCVVPAGATAVELVTVSGGRVERRERIDGAGAQRPTTRDMCPGWERGRWSPDGRRLYLRSEHDCNGVRLLTTGVLALVGPAEWVDVRGVSMAGGPANVTVRRYRALGAAPALPAELAGVADVGDADRAVVRAAARSNANARLTTGEVIEATREVDARVVEAWLVERGQGFALDAGRLAALAEAGVPERVIDIVVAVTYPKRFAIDRLSRDPELRPANSVATGRVAHGDSARPLAVGRRLPFCDDPAYTGPYMSGYCQSRPYSACSYDDYWGYSRYNSAVGCGAGRYGMGYLGGGYYGYDRGGTVIVIREPSTGTTRDASGRVVKGAGYTRRTASGSTGGSDRAAVPRSDGRSGASNPDRASVGTRGGYSAGSSGRSGGSDESSSSGSAGGTSTSSGSGERTAKPRP